MDALYICLIKFEVRGFSFGGIPNATWYGIQDPSSKTEIGKRLIPDVISSTATPFTAKYSFIKSAGNWVSYKDFVQFRLYDPYTKAFIATADLKKKPAELPAAPAPAPAPEYQKPAEAAKDPSSALVNSIAGIFMMLFA